LSGATTITCPYFLATSTRALMPGAQIPSSFEIKISGFDISYFLFLDAPNCLAIIQIVNPEVFKDLFGSDYIFSN
jgi:hypothetical protein